MKTLLNSLFALFCLVIILPSCGNDDDTSVCDDSFLSYKMNGELWTAETFNNTLFNGEDPNVPGVPTRRCDIRATSSDGGYLTIVFNNPDQNDADCVEEGSDYVSFEDVTSSLQNAFFFQYRLPDGTQSSVLKGTLSITSCDPATKNIKGTFSFDDEFYENVGTEGNFSVCFK